MKTFLIYVILITVSINCKAQTPMPDNKLGAWYLVDINHLITNKLSIKTGVELHSFEVLDNINLILYYTGIDYNLNNNITLCVGYMFLDIDTNYAISGENHMYENRPFEQISFKHKRSQLSITHRLRLEHRFLNYKHTINEKHRFRYRLGAKIDLNNYLFIHINNEVFANLKNDVFTENRFYAGVGIPLSKNNSLQFGYINHNINKSNYNRLHLGLLIKTDLRKKRAKLF